MRSCRLGSGAKHYIRVLQLLREHAVEQVQRAIEQSRTEAGFDIEALLQRVRRQGTGSVGVAASLDLSCQSAAVRAVQVPEPDVPERRPKPVARLIPLTSVTLMLPASATRPEARIIASLEAT